MKILKFNESVKRSELRQQALDSLNRVINDREHTVLITVPKGDKYYINKDSWYKGDGVQYKCYVERWGTNTSPKFYVVLKSFENDAETLLVKIINKSNQVK